MNESKVTLLRMPYAIKYCYRINTSPTALKQYNIQIDEIGHSHIEVWPHDSVVLILATVENDSKLSERAVVWYDARKSGIKLKRKNTLYMEHQSFLAANTSDCQVLVMRLTDFIIVLNETNVIGVFSASLLFFPRSVLFSVRTKR